MKNVFKKLTVFLLVLSMLMVFGSISFAADGEKVAYEVVIHVTDGAPYSAFFVDMTLIGKDAAGNDVVIDSAEKLKCIDECGTNSILRGKTDIAAIPYKLNVIADSNTAIGRTLAFDIVVKLNGISYDLEAVVNEASKGVYTVTAGNPANFYMETPMKVTGTYQYHSDVDFIFYEEITHSHIGNVIIPGVKPTCTKSGVSQYSECAVCGKKMSDYKILDPIKHADDDNNSYCDNCGDILTDYIVSVDVVKPVDRYYDVEVKLIGKDKDGTDVVMENMNIKDIIAAEGSYELFTGKASVSLVPYKINFVTDVESAVQKALDMNINVLINNEAYEIDAVINDATTTHTMISDIGEYVSVSSGAPAVYHFATRGSGIGYAKKSLYHGDFDYLFEIPEEVIPKHCHKEEIIPGVAATCTKAGMTDSKKCLICGVLYDPANVIEPVRHTDADNDTICDLCGEKVVDYDITIDVIKPVAVDHNLDVILIGKDENGADVEMEKIKINDIIASEGTYSIFSGKAGLSLFPYKINIITDVTTKNSNELEFDIYVNINNEPYEIEGVVNEVTNTEYLDIDINDYVTALSGNPAKYRVITIRKMYMLFPLKMNWHFEFDYLFAYPEELFHTHAEEIIPAVAATCTKVGSTEGKKCVVCGEVLVAPETVNALGHTEEIIPAVTATCTEAGMTEGIKCSVCDEVLTSPEIAEATGHVDNDNDSYCDECGLQIRELTFVEKITEFFNKIINFFKNLFR